MTAPPDAAEIADLHPRLVRALEALYDSDSEFALAIIDDLVREIEGPA